MVRLVAWSRNVGPMVFSATTALRAFEAATGVRLHADPPESLRYKLLRLRFGLPRAEIFESTPADAARFGGGTVAVRVEHTDEPDRGVRERGLELDEIERGPRAGIPLIGGSAARANVQVTWSREGAAIDAAAEELWAAVTAFLHRL